MIVPFFGDQPFWGAMVSKAGAGANEAIPYKRLTVDALAEGIKQCLSTEAKAAAEKLAEDIAEEGDGAKNAVESFHKHLPMKGESSMRCSILPDHVAVWTLKTSNLRLSALAAELLVEKKKIRWQDLRLLRHYEWNDFEGPGEPVTGAGGALMKSAGGVVKGVGGMPVKWARTIRKRDKLVKKQRERRNPQTTRKSLQKEDAPGPNQVNKHKEGDENTGKLPHGGQHGAEKHLPEAHTLPKRAESGLEKHGSLPNGGPVSDHLHDADGEDSFSDISEASDDNLIQDLAEDTGAGFLKTGEALAKGKHPSPPQRLAVLISRNSSHGPLACHRPRLPQRPPLVW